MFVYDARTLSVRLMVAAPVILWFGLDLRLADNPALTAATARGTGLVPVFILDDEDAGPWRAGSASRWWLHGSLESLSRSLAERGAQLIFRNGRAEAVLDELLAETGADAVYWNRRYEPWAVARNSRIKRALRSRNVEARSFNASLLREPGTIMNGTGEPYRVFAAFWKRLRNEHRAESPLPAPKAVSASATEVRSERLADWKLRPSAPDWSDGLRAAWTPGEQAAQRRLRQFASGAAAAYREQRDRPGIDGTSRLAAHLHFGEIGPRQIWWEVTEQAMRDIGIPVSPGIETFLSEVAWREFSYHLLFHFPALPEAPLRAEFKRFPWKRNAKGLAAWQRGLTGFPIVDAGMRQLWKTGWMHNRVRMIVASFLVKDLLIDWRVGEKWFWDTLVDADLASNAASWQWVAGSGADAAPFFRVFNPGLQGSKFDPHGVYVRHWVPEIARLPDSLIHTPWKATAIELEAAGISLGCTYPTPVVDHALARERALDAFQAIKSRTSP